MARKKCVARGVINDNKQVATTYGRGEWLKVVALVCRNVEAYSLDRGFSRWICEGEGVESVRV